MYSFHVTLLRLWGAKKTVDLCKSKAWKSWVEIADEGRYFSIDPLFDARGQNLILVLGLILLSPPQNLTGLPYSSISGLEGTQRHWVSDKVSSESLFSLYKDNFLGSPPRFKTGHIQIAQCNTREKQLVVWFLDSWLQQISADTFTGTQVSLDLSGLEDKWWMKYSSGGLLLTVIRKPECSSTWTILCWSLSVLMYPCSNTWLIQINWGCSYTIDASLSVKKGKFNCLPAGKMCQKNFFILCLLNFLLHTAGLI